MVVGAVHIRAHLTVQVRLSARGRFARVESWHMRVAKYACPQCGCEGECPEEKVLEGEVCYECGFVFMPGKCAGLIIVESADPPPLPVAAPPRQIPKLKPRPRRRVSAAIAAAPKRKEKPEKKNSNGCFIFLIITLMLLLPLTPGVLLFIIALILLQMLAQK